MSIARTNDLFCLSIDQAKADTSITMELLVPVLNTRQIPATFSILKKYLPSIFFSKCFNEENYPFVREVKETEIGHLFEHILLEYLCEIKLARGIQNPVHNGLTKWDWDKDAQGIFNIQIDIGDQDREIFNLALESSIKLLETIFQMKAGSPKEPPASQT